MNTTDDYDALLMMLGYPPKPAPELRPFGYGAELGPWADRWPWYSPLVRRGWCIHFDAEGDFHRRGEHSKLIQALLTLAGQSPLPAIRDFWAAGGGWVFELENDDRRLSYHLPQPERNGPSDWCELGLAKALVEDWLGGSHVLLEADTGDQNAFCCMMPHEVYTAMCEHQLIDTPDEPTEPRPDRLTVIPGYAEYRQKVVCLPPSDKDKVH